MFLVTSEVNISIFVDSKAYLLKNAHFHDFTSKGCIFCDFLIKVIFSGCIGYAEIFSFVYGWIKAPDFNSGCCKCVTIEHTFIWVKTYIFRTFEDFSRFKQSTERFFFVTASCWPTDSNFTIRKCTCPSNILRFWITTIFLAFVVVVVLFFGCCCCCCCCSKVILVFYAARFEI